MARPSKWTPAVRERILDALRCGNVRRAAAQSAGISEDTLERWLKRYTGFAGAVLQAEADAHKLVVNALWGRAMAGDVRAQTFILERRYGWRESIQVDVRTEAARLAAELGMDADELMREAERIAQARWVATH